MSDNGNGWIKVWRKLSTNKFWLEKPFSKGQAWIDLIMFATQSTHTSTRNGTQITYKAGYVYESVVGLADRWGWSRPRVYRFLEQLKNDGMIDYERRTQNRTQNRTVNVTQLVTPLRIVNWELYQDRRTVSDTENRTQNRTRKRTHPKNDIYPKNESSKEEYNSRSAPTPLSGIPERGTDAFRNQSHLLLKPDEGTADDIPVRYREMCNNDFKTYWGYRNQ